MVLGLIAFVSLLTVEIYRTVQNAEVRSQQNSFSDLGDTLVASLRLQIDSPESCTDMLGGLKLVPGTRMPLGNGDLRFVYGTDIPGPFYKGQEVARGLILDSLHLNVEADPDMDTRVGVGTPPPRFMRYAVRLELTLDSVNRKTAVSGATTLNYTNAPGGGGPHDFYAWTDDKNNVVACYGRFSVGAFCNSVGGFYLVDLTSPLPSSERCRQSIYTRLNPGKAGEEVIGTCRIAGILPAGTCPAGYATPPFELQDKYGKLPFTKDLNFCLRCQ